MQEVGAPQRQTETDKGRQGQAGTDRQKDRRTQRRDRQTERQKEAGIALAQPIKVPSEQVYRAIDAAMEDVCLSAWLSLPLPLPLPLTPFLSTQACAREVESLRAAGGLTHERSAVLHCVFDDLKASVTRSIRQQTVVD